MNSFTRKFLLVFAGLVLGVMIGVGQSVSAKRANTLPLEDIRTLSEVFGKIKDNYVEDIPDKTLLENAIRGMLTGLDPHSSYLDQSSFKELRVGTSGEFGGLGIVVGMQDGFVKVISPIDDTPAQKAGIKAGDLIIRLGDTPVKGMSLDEAVKIMRGKPGTEIKLMIVREGEDKPLEIPVKRDKIRVKSVRSKELDKGYGYVRISQFQQRTTKDLRKAISKLTKDNKGKLKGLVLDLRNNPGGLLDSAVTVSDTFLTKGGIVSVKGRTKSDQLSHKATPLDMTKGAPIVVLVNAGSASASEIVAGALQDHKRAVIMGEKTFGKGSVQTVVPLGNQTAIKLTTARYYTPLGRSIQAKGIEPDIVLDNLKVSENGKNFDRIKEADLKKHLENDTDKKSKENDAKNARNARINLAKEDYALYEALNLLKGLHLLNSASKK
ncbi:MAG: S41 family peptidase [Gammaproteobacteria bacterium]|nr:S41 family peptidase [Gammaproteobacteria bacterium]MDH5778089.1 S41 family peptidase [Gammaproteobacteria bacterium]